MSLADITSFIGLIVTIISSIILPFIQQPLLYYNYNPVIYTPSQRSTIEHFAISIHNYGLRSANHILASLHVNGGRFVTFTSQPFLSKYFVVNNSKNTINSGSGFFEIEVLPPSAGVTVVGTIITTDVKANHYVSIEVRSQESIGYTQWQIIIIIAAFLIFTILSSLLFIRIWSIYEPLDLKIFRRSRKSKLAEVETTITTTSRMLELLQRGDIGEFNDLRGQSYSTPVDLHEANLERAILKEANLWEANLVEANLRGANLVEANLRGANLVEANLRGANLQGAYLEGAYLEGADLREANLQGAYLERAILIGANLQRAQLQGANLQRAQLQGADLQRAQLQGADLREADLREANLQGAYLQGANLQRAQLQGANLHVAYLRGADLRNVRNLPITTAEAQNHGAII